MSDHNETRNGMSGPNWAADTAKFLAEWREADQKILRDHNKAEIGTCDLCGQTMIRTADDCWHPWDVEKACPPEPSGGMAYSEWVSAGNRTGRPGREHFRAGAQ